MQFLLLILLCFAAIFSFAQRPFEIIQTIYFIGDAGKYETTNDILKRLKTEIENDELSTVVFLGDNIYPQGLDGKKKSENKLVAQLSILNNYQGNVFFIPGNHDWKMGKPGGYKVVLRQAEFVENYLNSTLVANKNSPNFLPANALPGPYDTLIAEGLRMIFIDSQWFLHAQIIHKTGKIGTRKNTKKLFYAALDSSLNAAHKRGERVVINMHHPIFTNGHHALFNEPFRTLINYTPFQIFGLLGLNKAILQDMPQPRYKQMRKQMLQIFDKYNNIVHVSGHDHNIQYFRHNNNHYIISGAGSKLSGLKKKKYPDLYRNDSKKGFVKAVFFKDGNVTFEAFYEDGTEEIIRGIR